MAIAVTSANTNTQVNGGRVVVRNSAGTPYTVVEDTTNGAIQVFKGNSTTPTSFAEQDSTNNPQSAGYGSMSCAIDSTDVIHIAYMYDNGKASQLRYVTFDADGTTDTFSGDVAIISDIGEDPTAITNLYTAIAIDSNDVPHIAYTEYPKIGGTATFTLMYTNKVGGSWNTSVEAHFVAGEDCYKISIAIDIDNIPVIACMYISGTLYSLRRAEGNANNATVFTTGILGGSSADRNTSICVLNNGDILIADSATSSIPIHRKAYGGSWTYQYLLSGNGTPVGELVSIVAVGDSFYIFYEDRLNNDIVYDMYDGSSWAGETTLETGTYNTPKAKWANLVDNDSGGALVTQTVNQYHIDASDDAWTDPDNRWTSEDNAFDGSTATSASVTTDGDTATGYLHAGGTNAPVSGDHILKVRARIYTGSTSTSVRCDAELYTNALAESLGVITGTTLTAAWSDYLELSIPTGGWTWQKISEIEVKAYGQLSAAGTAGLYEVEIEVTTYTKASATELDYTFADETATPDIQWNTLTLGAAGTDVNDERVAEVTGKQTANSERSAEVTGQQSVNSERAAEVTGIGSATDERSAETTGVDTANDERSAEVTGALATNDERAAELTGVSTANDSRAAEVTGKQDATDERSAEVTGTLGANSERASEVTGQIATQDERAAELTGIATTQDERSAEITGQQTAQDERGAEITGKATTTTTRAAELTGGIIEVDTRSAELAGEAVATDERSAEITGKITTTSTRAAEVTGTLGANDTRSAEVTGSLSVANTRSAEITGAVAAANTERVAETTGKQSTTTERSSEIIGKSTANTERGAEATGVADANDTRSAEVHGVDTDADTRSAEITGAIHVTSERSAELTGAGNVANTERAAEVSGKQSDTDTRAAELTGSIDTDDSRDAEITGIDSATTERSATVTGKQTASTTRAANITGVAATAQSERSANTTGKSTTATTRSAEVTGLAPGANTERSAELSGVGTITSTRSAEVTGVVGNVSERSAEITGGVVDTSTRSAIVTGLGVNPYCSKFSPYSKATSPYTANVSPYSAPQGICDAPRALEDYSFMDETQYNFMDGDNFIFREAD